MLKQVSILALMGGIVVHAALPAHAQRGGAGWEELGCVDARRNAARAVVRVGRGDGRYSAIQLRSERNDVLVNNVRVIFGNGDTQDVNVRELIREDTRTREIDVDGRNRFIQRVVMQVERAASSDRRGPAKLCVYGRSARAAVAPPRVQRNAPPRAQAAAWVELGCARTGLRDDYDVIPIGKSDGRFRAIRLRAVGGKVDVEQVRVVYGNGQPDLINYSQSIDRGRLGEILDLKGGDRYIRQVELVSKRDTRDAVRGIIRGVISGRGVRGAEVCVEGLEDDRFRRRR